MDKNYSFYRCHFERGTASNENPGLFAATEVVQAVCDAGFQKFGTSMRCYPSSPHCQYKYAKTPRDGMYKLRAVKMTDGATLDILIDTRMHPCLVMIEKHPDWQELDGEVKDTLEQMINDDAIQYNWNVNLQEHRTNTTQNLEEFISALSYMKDQYQSHQDIKYNITLNNTNTMEQNSEDLKLKVIQELTKGNVKIENFIMEVTHFYNKTGKSVTENPVITDEHIAKALIAINGKDKALNSQAAWLGACCFLAWNHGYPRNLGDCCKKIAELPLVDGSLEYECKYESIRKFGSWKFVSMDAREWPQYMPKVEEKAMFERCLTVYQALEKEIPNQALLG